MALALVPFFLAVWLVKAVIHRVFGVDMRWL